MAVRKTETRLPLNMQAADLGQAVVAADSRCALVSYVPNPLAINRENVYVVFVTDTGLATAANSYEWTFTEGGGAPQVQTTQIGEMAFTPTVPGTLTITVRIVNSASTAQATLTLQQVVVPANAELESLLMQATDDSGPAMGSPDVLREMINEHSIYYQAVTPQTADPGDGYQRLVFSLAYDGAARKTAQQRKQHMEELALSLNSGAADFATLCTTGAGVCAIRPLLLSMTIPGMITWTLLPEDTRERAVATDGLLQSLTALDENKRIDLFNIVRFPKSNIVYCGRVLEALRNAYFNTTSFNDILTGMSGAGSQWIIGQYRQGPVIRN